MTAPAPDPNVISAAIRATKRRHTVWFLWCGTFAAYFWRLDCAPMMAAFAVGAGWHWHALNSVWHVQDAVEGDGGA